MVGSTTRLKCFTKSNRTKKSNTHNAWSYSVRVHEHSTERTRLLAHLQERQLRGEDLGEGLEYAGLEQQLDAADVAHDMVQHREERVVQHRRVGGVELEQAGVAQQDGGLREPAAHDSVQSASTGLSPYIHMA